MSCCLCTFGSKQASMNKDAEPVVRPDKQSADNFYIRRTGDRPNKKKPAKFHGLVFDVRIGRTWDPENKKQANYVHWCRVSSGTKKKKGEGCSRVPNVYNVVRKQRRPCQGSESLNK